MWPAYAKWQKNGCSNCNTCSDRTRTENRTWHVAIGTKIHFLCGDNEIKRMWVVSLRIFIYTWQVFRSLKQCCIFCDHHKITILEYLDFPSYSTYKFSETSQSHKIYVLSSRISNHTSQPHNITRSQNLCSFIQNLKSHITASQHHKVTKSMFFHPESQSIYIPASQHHKATKYKFLRLESPIIHHSLTPSQGHKN